MIPPRTSAIMTHSQREVQNVQQYIQSRLQTDEPYLLSVNSTQVEEYYDEVQNYVKQKQRQTQVRRPVPMNQHPSAHPAYAAAPVMPVRTQHHQHASERSLQQSTPQSFSKQPISASTTQARLPGVEWLLASAQSRTTIYSSTPSIHPPVADALPPVHTYLSHSARPRMLKKQQTM